ncbi:unnamed protein product [Urochloa humidicola]
MLLKPIPTNPHSKFNCGKKIKLRATEEQEEVSRKGDGDPKDEEANTASSIEIDWNDRIRVVGLLRMYELSNGLGVIV